MTYLDGIRGYMCILVVLFHYAYRYSEIFGCEPFLPYFSWGGKAGVAVFFLVSGFLTAFTSKKIFEKGTIWWLKHKFMRLYPHYFFACMLITLALLIFHLPGRDNITIVSFFRSLIMFPVVGVNVDGAHWYVFALVSFYVVFLFVKRLNLLDKEITYVVIGITYAIACVVLVAAQNTTMLYKIAHVFSVYVINIQPWIGVLLYLLATKKINLKIGGGYFFFT